MNKKSCFSPGKVILSGEHSVVYGKLALVSAIDLGIKVSVNGEGKFQQKDGYLKQICDIFEEKYLSELKNSKVKNQVSKKQSVEDLNTDNLKFYIKSNLPQKSGLGSSAAFAHVVFLCLLDYFNIKLSKEEIFNLVLEAEKHIHGKSSGVDPSAVVFGGTQVFRVGRTSNGKKTVERKELKDNLKLEFMLINSGEAVETTGEMVDLVKSRVASAKIIKKIGKVTTDFIKSIGSDKFDYSLIGKNQRLLEELGVVGKKAKNLVKEIENLGGFAKITGAGGVKKGSGWLLAYHPNKSKLDEFVVKNNLESYKIQIK